MNQGVKDGLEKVEDRVSANEGEVSVGKGKRLERKSAVREEPGTTSGVQAEGPGVGE
jgi:hypothetical protein